MDTMNNNIKVGSYSISGEKHKEPIVQHTSGISKHNLPTNAEHVERLKYFLATAPTNWPQNETVKRLVLTNGEQISCVYWKSLFYITGTDIVKTLIYRFQLVNRPVINSKKFEEGVFSDLRNLKPGIDATLEEPRSEFLEILYRNGCIRTQKKQKVFYWYSVPHERLFHDALERDLKREHNNINNSNFLNKNLLSQSLFVNPLGHPYILSPYNYSPMSSMSNTPILLPNYLSSGAPSPKTHSISMGGESPIAPYRSPLTGDIVSGIVGSGTQENSANIGQQSLQKPLGYTYVNNVGMGFGYYNGGGVYDTISTGSNQSAHNFANYSTVNSVNGLDRKHYEAYTNDQSAYIPSQNVDRCSRNMMSNETLSTYNEFSDRMNSLYHPESRKQGNDMYQQDNNNGILMMNSGMDDPFISGNNDMSLFEKYESIYKDDEFLLDATSPSISMVGINMNHCYDNKSLLKGREFADDIGLKGRPIEGQIISQHHELPCK